MPPFRIDREFRLPPLLAALLALSLAIHAAPAAQAAPTDLVPLDEYSRETWTTRNGLPHNSINDIAQTPEGYIWVATWEGAARFNGREFVNFDREKVPGLPDSGIRAFHQEPDGSLLLGGGRGGLARLSLGQWAPFAPAPALISELLRDSQGRLWVGTESYGLMRIDPDGSRTQYTRGNGLPGDSVYAIAEDAQGRIWLGTSDALAVFADGRLQAMPDAAGLPPGAILALALTPDGRLLVGGERGAYVGDAGSNTPHFDLLDPALAGEAVSRLMLDSSGQLWLGTINRGLIRLGALGMERLDASSGLNNNRVLALMEDRERNIWVGTNGGLVRLGRAPFSVLTRSKGLADNFIRTVLEHSDGSLLIGSTGGLDRLQGERITRVGAGSPWEGVSVLSLAEAPEGDIWVGTYTHGALRFRGDRVVQHIHRGTGIAGNEVRAVLHGRDGRIWLGTTNGLSRIGEDGVRNYGTEDGMPGLYVTSLLETREGEIWVGTGTGLGIIAGDSVRSLDIGRHSEAEFVFDVFEEPDGQSIWLATDRGLLRYRVADGHLGVIGRAAGLPFDKIFHMVDDLAGSLWLTGNRGVLRIDREAAMAVADGRQATLAYERFSESDGMASSQCNGGTSPTATRRQDGSVWIATAYGVAYIHPARLAQFAATPPPVVIESLRVDDREYPLQQDLRLPAGSQRLELSFAGLSFAMAHRTRYRYQLLGFDRDWVERGSLPYAQFTNLPPGDYELQVTAAHPNGAWNSDGASLRFRLLPHPWQRQDVQAAAILALLLLAAGVLHWRSRNLRRRAEQLQQLVQRRTADLQQQTEKLIATDREKSQLMERLRQQSEDFERQAREDALTGLMNRRAFDEALETEFARAQRGSHPLCLALLDLDHFKRVNDEWSHAIGDIALQRVAEVMREQFRSIDSLARWGGEEFTVLMPYTSLEQARAACERLREAVAAIDCREFAPGLRLSISVGIAQCAGLPSHGRLLTQADAALYRAKQNGRNQVVAETA